MISSKDYELKLAASIEKDSKSFFSYVNNKKKLGSKIEPLKDVNNSIVTDDLEMANIVNNYFSTFFTKDSGDCLSNLASFLDENEYLSSIYISSRGSYIRLYVAKLKVVCLTVVCQIIKYV